MKLTPKFLIGFEFEGMVRDSIYLSFKKAMKDLHPNQIKFGYDNSVRKVPRGYRAVEIRTSTLTYSKGLIILEDMLSFLYLASQTKDFITNDTCGFHVNVSEKNIFSNDNQIEFYAKVTELFDEYRVLELYKREKNRYCAPIFKRGVARNYEDVLYIFHSCLEGNKYLSVALRNSPQHGSYKGPELSNHRIEFRCIGNKNYHLRFADLQNSMFHIEDCLKKSFDFILN